MSILKPFPTFILLLALSCSNNSRTDETVPGNDAAGSTEKDTSIPAITGYSSALPLEKIKMPAGFKIDIYAEVENARAMALSPSGIVYVGNRDKDKVYAVKDTDGDHKADQKWVIASGLNMPNGVAFKDGDLYVAEVSRITKFAGIESKLSNPPSAVVVKDDYPKETHHGWKYIAFGPDGKLYVPVGAPCNICEPKDKIYASITRLNVDGSGLEIFASGVRNSVGFTWHPKTKALWFTDNGRDMLGDNTPSCELNVAPKSGMHFGYPYCHEGSVKDPEFGNKRPCSDFVPPADKLGPHVAPLGLKFYTGKMFPTEYSNQLFVAEHGSWNRSKKIGYNVTLVNVSNDKVSGHKTFASGWLDEDAQKAWGRPVDVLVMPDGSLLVSDDQANVIYRISYTGG
ncbi:MAG TPA: sorbosone dehydrogenase family protein [Ohtaekwangia sp.]|nr:sorbosone dehydrogenase family protein [Ohtaekwangia sp.]